jgi:hypothetical protein
MELRPTRTEARLLVACISVFWLIGGGFALFASTTTQQSDEQPNPLIVLPFALAFGAGIALYVVLFRIAGRETGRSPFEFVFPMRRRPNEGWLAAGLDGWRVILKLVDPRWYALLVRTTEWNRFATGALLLGSFLWVVATGIVMQLSIPPT